MAYSKQCLSRLVKSEMNKKDEKRYLQAYQKQLNKPKYGVRYHTIFYISCYLAGFTVCLISGIDLVRDSFLEGYLTILGGFLIGMGWTFGISLSQWKAIAPHISTTSMDDRIRELEL